MAIILPSSGIRALASRTAIRKCFGLGIESRIPLLRRSRREEFSRLGARIGHKDFNLSELCLHFAEHIRDLFWPADISPHQEAIRSAPSNLFQRALCC
jgi:hypothetical protein